MRDTYYPHIEIIAINQVPKRLDAFAATIPFLDKLRNEPLMSIDTICVLLELDVRQILAEPFGAISGKLNQCKHPISYRNFEGILHLSLVH
jgi:hypothetical protein